MTYKLKNGQRPNTTTGTGELKYPGFTGQVDYEIVGSLDQLRPGVSVRAAIMTTAEVAEAAFKELRGHLRLAGGKEYRLQIVAYTAGSSTAYAELTV